MKPRLAEFIIDGLFGLYSHRIPLNDKEHITIIIGPNGRGKTVCLRLIEALFRNRYSYFFEIPFRTAQFLFTEGQSITIARSQASETSSAPPISFILSAPGKEDRRWVPATIDSSTSSEIRRHVPSNYEPIGPDLWIDRTDGEELNTLELAERFRLSSKLIAALQQDLPDEFANLVKHIDCHLIETQRLLVLPSSPSEDEPSFVRYTSVRRARGRESHLAIQQKAQKLKDILRDTLTNYASLSQSLDRSFPLRVFEAQGSASLSQDQLRQELKQLDERREALMGAGILAAEYMPVALRGGNIEPGVAMALEIYVKDAVQKLNIFNDLRSRLDLFKRLVENRFIDKTLRINRNSGFEIISKTNAVVPLDKLSSGEQHQLILVFDLLFEVSENALILIDEPELSLHVAWQKRFIESLMQIIALNAFDVILATHSPAIVGEYFSLAVELGPVDE
jgi:predicted ATP-dependent endonuclease of OLD family